MRNSQLGIASALAVTILFPNLVSAHKQNKSVYDYRQSAEFRSLDSHSKDKLSRVVKDFGTLETALNKFMSDHRGQPPESLAELVPAYLASLPEDPFATQKGRAGYLYQRRDGPAYVIAWKDEFKIQTLDGSWEIKSVGLPTFPLRYASKNGRGLLRRNGYWGRYILDVF